MTQPIISYFGQSCFLLEFESTKILIDPGNKKLGKIEADIVYSTHSHFDHASGINEFLDFNKESAIFISNKEVTKKYTEWGSRVKTIEDGTQLNIGELTLEFIYARHGIFKGELNLGIVISTPTFKFGHVGDGVSFQGFRKKKLDILAVPISGLFAASPNRVLQELPSFEEPLPTIIPMHWLFRSPKKFCKKLSKEFPQIKCIVPKKEEIVSY